jgi:Nif-specific regulatory protein
LRDLESRNGTRVDGDYITHDCELISGQTIQIGSTLLLFTLDPDLRSPKGSASGEADTATEIPLLPVNPEILHRARRSKYRAEEVLAADRDRTSRELSKLYRLALDMGTAETAAALADRVLDTLFSVTSTNIGAILLLPRPVADQPRSDELQVAAFKSTEEASYQRVSDYLSQTVLRDKEAVLAKDVAADRHLANRDSLGEISAHSVICAPIRVDELIYGVIHLYSTNPDNRQEPEDLEFTLAVADQMGLALEQIQQRERLAAGLERAKFENQTLREQLRQDVELVGESPSLCKLKERIELIAPTGAIVLIRGESGVGKELVARAIHSYSARHAGPFVTMNCAALSESLLESELFGHEKGAFTGATARKIGKFEQADGGTLFLDEVGEMTPSIQAKFLRVLEGHPFERVGGGTSIQVDVRVVAATNRDLEHSVKAGTFRKDLYFRLQVVEIDVAPLRDRKSDIPILARHFLARFARRIGRQPPELSPAAIDSLMDYDWPGNVRELQNTMERAVILTGAKTLDSQDITLSALGRSEQPDVASGTEPFQPVALDVMEQQHILATLDATNWNKSQAAQLLGIERSTLDRKLKRYDVGRPER